MFVPKTGLSSAASLRNPRRRQRTSSEESVKAPNAKRQRSTLRLESSKISTKRLSDAQDSLVKEESGASIVGPNPTNIDSTILQKSIPIRNLKSAEGSANEIDEPIVLSKTDIYTVSQLPSFPDQLRGLHSEFRGVFGADNGYALALTESHAIIWPYNASKPTANPLDVFIIAFPESCKDSRGTVPLGIFLSNASGETPGLLVVQPTTGRIVYWETILNAGSLGLSRQKETGHHGCISGLLSGEHATDIINCEPSGVIITLSSGRVVHVALRDPQARPTLMPTFLRSSHTNSGIFGGIKSVFSGGCWRKDVAAVKAAQSHQRGQRDIVIATSSGVFEVWDTHWSNGSILKRHFDIRQQLCSFLGRDCADGASDFDLKIMDFALMSCESNVRESRDAGAETWRVCLIVAPSREATFEGISVVQVILSKEILLVSSSTMALNLSEMSIHHSQVKPKIFIPKSGHTGFIVIGQSVTLLSLSFSNNSPTQQLLIESDRVSPPFLDQISFRGGEDYRIVGSGFENLPQADSGPTCLIMVRNFGVIRITVASRAETDSSIDDAHITAKTKLEQAVFYGTKLDNPLNLSEKGGFDFPLNEIEQAALDICDELLRSTSSYIPATLVSLEQNLRLRSRALEDLATLLLRHNKDLRRQTRYELLWSAEKLAALKALWKVEEVSRKAKGQGHTFLAHVIKSMNEKFKTQSRSQNEDTDDVRDWFLYDAFRMEHVIPWIFKSIKPQRGHSGNNGRKMIEEILEASDLSLAVLETAFNYRAEHARRYGLDIDCIEGGMLTANYDGLSEFWTSEEIVYIESGHLLDLELETCRAWIQQTTPSLEPREHQALRRIAENSARQLRVLGLMHHERVQWLSIHDDPNMVDESIAIEQAHVQQRRWQLFKLAGIGQLEHAISLAESFRDMSALVELIIELQDQATLLNSGDATDTINCESDDLGRRISIYFEKFGESWADAFFSRQISMGQAGTLFTMRKFQPFISRFLHKHPTYGRLCWINDTIGENNYEMAGKSLESLAVKHESDIWSHRVELSLSKLAKLAALEGKDPADHKILNKEVRRLEDLAEIDAVQEVIYSYIVPALQGAIDQKAEIELAMDQFGKSVIDLTSLREVLYHALTKLITRQILTVDEMVDVLTLMDGSQIPDDIQSEVSTKEFYLALRVIRLASSTQSDPLHRAPIQKLVWRRCMIRSDWKFEKESEDSVGDGLEDPVHKTALFRTLSLCLKDRHFGDMNSPSIYIPSSPSDVLLNESEVEIILSRFPSEQRSRINRDLSRENEVLHQQITEWKLDFWYRRLFASVEESIVSSAALDTVTTRVSDALEGEHTDHKPPVTRSQLTWL